MFIDVACSQKKKYNQNAYGDFFTSHRFPSMNRVVAVLSDGYCMYDFYNAFEVFRKKF